MNCLFSLGATRNTEFEVSTFLIAYVLESVQKTAWLVSSPMSRSCSLGEMAKFLGTSNSLYEDFIPPVKGKKISEQSSARSCFPPFCTDPSTTDLQLCTVTSARLRCFFDGGSVITKIEFKCNEQKVVLLLN